MGEPTPHRTALLLMAAFSRHEAALAWARQRAVEEFGPVALESPTFHFTQTDYYESTMGLDLRKVFFLFERPFDAAELADVKLLTNQWEGQYTQQSGHPEPRPLNLDPGYLTLAKLVLASTKDHAHRIYLRRGIYAELTLYFRHDQWQPHQWTYADYRREDYQEFFSQCRNWLHQRDRRPAGS
jgi:hypothetical protein